MNLFGRAWRVVVGTNAGDGLDVSNLAVKFKISRTLYARAGTCELEIYNLSDRHRHELITARRRRTYVSVDAGYVEGMSRLFTGDLRKAQIHREGASWVAKITAGDGAHALRGARVSRSFAAGSPVHTAAQALADTMGVGVGNAVRVFQGADLSGATVFEDGTVLQGDAASELSRLCAAARLEWSIQDGNIQILPLNGAIEREAILLSADTGMVDAPEVVSRRVITVKALIFPGLVPGQRVMVDSQVRSGVHTIRAAEYSGDTEGNDWHVSMTCARPRPPLTLLPPVT